MKRDGTIEAHKLYFDLETHAEVFTQLLFDEQALRQIVGLFAIERNHLSRD